MAILIKVLETEFCSTKWDSLSQGQFARGQSDINPIWMLTNAFKRSKVHETLVRDFLFADDCALAAHTEEDLQCLADCFSTATKAFGLTISIRKTEVLYQPAPNTSRPVAAIKIDGTALNNVEDFTYLGSCPCLPLMRPWTKRYQAACPRLAVHLGACGAGCGASVASPRQQELQSTGLLS